MVGDVVTGATVTTVGVAEVGDEVITVGEADVGFEVTTVGAAEVGPAATIVTEEGPLSLPYGWPVVASAGDGTAALVSGDVVVDEGLIRTTVPAAPLLAELEVGAGRVVFLVAA